MLIAKTWKRIYVFVVDIVAANGELAFERAVISINAK